MPMNRQTLIKIISACHRLAQEATGETTSGPAGNGLISESGIVGPVTAVLLERALSNPDFAGIFDGLQ